MTRGLQTPSRPLRAPPRAGRDGRPTRAAAKGWAHFPSRSRPKRVRPLAKPRVKAIKRPVTKVLLALISWIWGLICQWSVCCCSSSALGPGPSMTSSMIYWHELTVWII